MPVGIQGTALAVKGQHPCGDPGGSTGYEGQVPLCGYRGQSVQSIFMDFRIAITNLQPLPDIFLREKKK